MSAKRTAAEADADASMSVGGGGDKGPASSSGKNAGDKKADMGAADADPNVLTITPLGAGQEVGRSCHILKFKGFTIMLDCGIHPGLKGKASLPFVSQIELNKIDLVLITHFHLDHCGALPWLLERSTFSGRVFMTPATKAIYRWILEDYVRVSNISNFAEMYSLEDVENSLAKIETISYHQETNMDGVRFTPYCAGHVLGACMFDIEIAGVRLVYTGDFSREEDRHLMAAEVPPNSPDILITESTFGVRQHESRQTREHRFTKTIHDVVDRGGRCLIPVFALGRAQELLLILDDYWQNHDELHRVPIYYASALARRCMAVYKTYVNVMKESIQKTISINNPFNFRHVSYIRNLHQFDGEYGGGPCVMLASPGMLQSGLSREIFERWASNKANCVLLAGYVVNGTLAKDLLKAPKKVTSEAGHKIDRECDIAYISFSAHVDYAQNRDFIRALDPTHIVLVHGEKHEMGRFKMQITTDLEADQKTASVFDPRNAETVLLHYRGEKMAKVLGSLAQSGPVQGRRVSGILVAKEFNYMVVAPTELGEYTELRTTTIRQRQAVSFPYTLELLHNILAQVHGAASVAYVETEMNRIGHRPQRTRALEVMGSVTAALDAATKMLVVEWSSSPESDMWADAVMAAVLQIESRPQTIKMASTQLSEQREADFKALLAQSLSQLLGGQFGPGAVSRDGDALRVRSNNTTGTIHLSTLEAESEDEELRRHLTNAIHRLENIVRPHAHAQDGCCPSTACGADSGDDDGDDDDDEDEAGVQDGVKGGDAGAETRGGGDAAAIA
ncbi:cleavage and polyadenylation specificity factor subunit 3 [Salpingoeca rosetta]|uniref:Cleavage and polyadenylation specificity factor subunit 3 n=1 Tax=Salpingoeca rosetta (strain ATCC 50818 / BSB-021) TaxID=946362 RepID=F2TVQ4_SALR5|nr:cleavage and polyadenylation specificity factor subunit 3 [Salpingoeca rosetta]EGD72150.1 cleavage and polyadenylation specificity factor subunit 3 [Salpingoeca rosetta]|eukprot:XP_004998722.1 cleavage and polyadenylation specificity factor subunit 3 [Salpingoeca rosetta]